MNISDIHISELKYVRFKSADQLLDNNKVKELLTMITSTLQLTASQPSKLPVESCVTENDSRTKEDNNSYPDHDIKKPLDQWNATDIRQWLKGHKVPDKLVLLYDFQSINEVQDYSKNLHADSNKEYTKYAVRYSKSYPDDVLENYVFNRLVNALSNLPESESKMPNSKVTIPQTSPKPPPPQSSATCNVL